MKAETVAAMAFVGTRLSAVAARNEERSRFLDMMGQGLLEPF